MAFGDIVQGPTAINAVNHIGTLGASPTAGNLIVIVCGDVAGNLAAGTGMSPAVNVQEPFNVDNFGIFYRVVQGGDDATWDVSSGNDTPGFIMEIEGPWAGTPLDVTATSTGADNPDTQTTGTTGTTSVANAFAIAGLTYRDVAGTATAWSNSFTERGEVAGSFQAVFVATKVLTSTGTVETTATLTGGSGRCWGGIAVFSAGSLGPAPSTCRIVSVL